LVKENLDDSKPCALSDVFEATVGRFPHFTAVEYEGEQMSYAELDSMANRVARWLLSKEGGINPCQDEVVAFFSTKILPNVCTNLRNLQSWRCVCVH